jgi:UDP-GlcNAc:undecaprenyl-phosphate/decaprenyl-phosphate GlcNAc-1-phosphate transferase
MFKYTVIFIVSLIAALFCTPMARCLAVRMGVMDLPGERRVHSQPVPRLGGVAVFLSMVLAFIVCTLCDRFFEQVFFGCAARLALLLGAASIVAMVGALDDAFSLRPGVKLAGQAAAAFVLLYVGAGISTIGGIHLGIFGVPLTMVWLLAVTNAFNLIDGLDGLAAGVGVIVSATLFANFIYLEDVASAMLLAALCGALLGFLRYNFHPAQIFLGDSGALLIGFILAAVSMHSGNRPSAVVAIVVPILAMGLPLAETALTTMRRLLRVVRLVGYNRDKDRYEFLFGGGAALFTADRQHIHHKLLDLGLSHRNAVLLLYGISLVLAAAAFGIVIYRQVNLALLLMAFGIVSIVGIRRLDYGELHLLRKGVLLPLLDSTVVYRKELQMLADLAFIVISYFAAILIEAGGTISTEAKQAFLQSVPLVAVTQINVFALSGLYRRSYRSGGIGDVLGSLKSVLFAIAASWLAVTVFHGVVRYSPKLAILDGYLLATMAIGARLSFRVLEYVFKIHSGGHRRAVIYGIGDVGMSVLYEIRNNPELDLMVLGFVNENAGPRPHTLDGLPIFGAQALDDLIEGGQVEEVIVAVQSVSEPRLEHLREICGNAGIMLRRFSIGWHEVTPLATPRTGAHGSPLIQREGVIGGVSMVTTGRSAPMVTR